MTDFFVVYTRKETLRLVVEMRVPNQNAIHSNILSHRHTIQTTPDLTIDRGS